MTPNIQHDLTLCYLLMSPSNGFSRLFQCSTLASSPWYAATLGLCTCCSLFLECSARYSCDWFLIHVFIKILSQRNFSWSLYFFFLITLLFHTANPDNLYLPFSVFSTIQNTTSILLFVLVFTKIASSIRVKIFVCFYHYYILITKHRNRKLETNL